MTTTETVTLFDAKWNAAQAEYQAAARILSDVEYEQAMKMRAVPDEVSDLWTDDSPEYQALVAPIKAAQARAEAAFAVIDALRNEVLDAVELPDDEGPWG